MMTNDSLTSSMQKMLGYFQELRQLMNEDKHNFIQRDTDKLEESNQKKSVLLDQLSQVAKELGFSTEKGQSDYFLDVIGKKSAELKTLAIALEEEMIHCYESLSINNKIIFTNIQRLKEFWGKLSLLNAEAECVYDQKANTR